MAPLTDKPFSAQVQMAMKHNHSELFHLNLYRDQAIHHRINHLMLIRTAGIVSASVASMITPCCADRWQDMAM